jgi:Phage tail assembly chaperone protein
MIYIFDSVGRCVCKTHQHYSNIEEIKESILNTAQSFNTDIYIEDERNFDIKMIRLKDGVITAIDPKPEGRYIYNYDKNEWELDTVSEYYLAKNKRDTLLIESNASQYPDIQEEMTEQKKQEWKEYRKRLRDFPDDYESLKNYQWPIKPH